MGTIFNCGHNLLSYSEQARMLIVLSIMMSLNVIKFREENF